MYLTYMYLAKEVEIVKEVISCDVSLVAMFGLGTLESLV